MQRILLVASLASLAAACSGGTTTGPDAADVAIDAVPDAMPPSDTAPSDAPNVYAPLSYVPVGCTYTVSTVPGTSYNVMGDNTTFGPAPAPLRVHVTWASDPSTSIAALWQTADGATLAAAMQYGTSPTQLTLLAIGHVSTVGAGTSRVYMHEVHVCGLTPDTTYYYQVGGAGNWSATQSFHTAPTASATAVADFAVAGDSRESPMTYQQIQASVLGATGMNAPDFQIFTGDLVFYPTLQSQWNAWFDAAAATMATMPYVFVQGNHEALSVNYLAQIAQPQTGNMQQDELYFSFDYGPVHFVVLNDTPYADDYADIVGGTELAWLTADLAAVNRTRTPWVIATHHKSLFTTSMHQNDSDVVMLRAAWPPVFTAGGVDAVMSGHDHVFQVTQPLVGNGTVAPSGQRGVVYFTAAGGGAMLYDTGTNPIAQYMEMTYNYALVHVTGTTLQITPYRLDGSVITQGVVMLSRP